MWRVWSEHTPLARVASEAPWLARWQVHPIMAVRPNEPIEALADAADHLRAEGLRFGVWPLLDDARGYWPGERNVAAFWSWSDEVIEGLARHGVQPAWLAVDLEPPLQQVHRLRHGPVAASPRALWRMARENLDPARFEIARAALAAGAARLHARGVETLAVTLPLAAHDLRDRAPLWQDLFEAPWSEIGWSSAGIMAYSSMVAGYSRGLLSLDDAAAIHYRLLRHLARELGPRAHASLGVTGAGKLGDEPAYPNPQALRVDVQAAHAAGVHDLALFCLEGLIDRPDRDAWMDAFTDTTARVPPQTPRAHLLRWGSALVRRALLMGLTPR